MTRGLEHACCVLMEATKTRLGTLCVLLAVQEGRLLYRAARLRQRVLRTWATTAVQGRLRSVQAGLTSPLFSRRRVKRVPTESRRLRCHEQRKLTVYATPLGTSWRQLAEEPTVIVRQAMTVTAAVEIAYPVWPIRIVPEVRLLRKIARPIHKVMEVVVYGTKF